MVRANQGRFTIARLRPGYAIEDVDQFISRIEAALVSGTLESDPVTAEDVRAVMFRATRFQPGYDELEVDAALDAYERDLRLRELIVVPAALPAGQTAASGAELAGPVVTGQPGPVLTDVVTAPDDTPVPHFSTTMLRPGYAKAEVDRLVARIAATLAGQPIGGRPVTAAEVNQVRFHTVVFSAGYDQDEVDAMLDQCEQQLRERLG